MSADYAREDAHLRRIVSNEKKGFSTYRENGNVRADEIMELLRQDPRLSVDRCVIAGSIGKGTSLGVNHGPDYDIDIFLNGVDLTVKKGQLFKDHLKIIQKILNRSGKYEINFVSDFAVGCQHKATGLELDVVPAVNFYEANSALGQSPSGIQLKQVLELLRSNPNMRKYLSSSVGEAVVEFVKGQPEFVKDIVIIGKLWNKFRLGDVGCYVAGRSSIIELVAIRAALDEMTRASNNSPSHFRALKLFLSTLAKEKNQVQVFFKYNLLPESARSKFNSMKIHNGIILDPVNPYHNFLKGIHKEKKKPNGTGGAWPKFCAAAQQCLKELQAHENRSSADQHLMLRLDKVVPTSK